MHELVEWFKESLKSERHLLITIVNFIFEFLAIHPFQYGNGRTSRLLTNLALLRSGYEFTSIVSHEKLIEERKAEYYLALNKTQKTWKKKKEDMYSWISFFLGILKEQASRVIDLLQEDNISHLLSPKQAEVLDWINKEAKEEFSRKDAIAALQMAPRTVEEAIKKLISYGYIIRIGQGAGTRYKKKK